ncbi:MAG: hypothetical protein QOH91_2186, partial [Mycobacterium sp.]|nr:hypothetical protein [Mycobacterium sp.]
QRIGRLRRRRVGAEPECFRIGSVYRRLAIRRGLRPARSRPVVAVRRSWERRRRRRISLLSLSIVIWSAAVGSGCDLLVCVLDGVVDAAGDRCRTPVSTVRSLPNCDVFSAGRRAGVDRCRGAGRGRRRAGGVVAGSPRRVRGCGGWRFRGASAGSRRWRAAGWVSVRSVGSGAGRAAGGSRL